MQSPLRISAALAVVVVQLITPLAAQDLITSSASLWAASATSSASAQTHTISVGIDHKFKPEVTQAEAGDLIEFLFFPPNHSVVRAEYEFPCIPYEMTGRRKTGFFSGFHPVDTILVDPPSWTLKINDTNPIFFYCSAPGSCINYGMVAVINPNATTSLENQRQLAKKAAYMLNPGETFPAEGSLTTASSTTSTSSTPTTAVSTTPASSATAVAATPSKSSSGLSKGAIAGIAVAGAAIVGLAAALFYFIGRSKTIKAELNRSNTPMHSHSGSTYLNPYFPGPKSDVSNERSSAMGASDGRPPYEYPGTLAAVPDEGRGEPKTEYYDHTDENRYRGSPPPVSDGRYSHQNQTRERMGNMSPPPRRHPSVLLNPHDPREMEAGDS